MRMRNMKLDRGEEMRKQEVTAVLALSMIILFQLHIVFFDDFPFLKNIFRYLI